jgi:hypothetical protein
MVENTIDHRIFILLEELLDFFLLVTISLLTDQEGEQQL